MTQIGYRDILRMFLERKCPTQIGGMDYVVEKDMSINRNNPVQQ